jgi:hypothetical protein
MNHIYAHPDGWIVKLIRGGIRYQAFIAHGTDRAAALKKAEATRDEFIRIHGAQHVIPARSNTGLLGITEVTKWSHGKPQPCFQVTLGDPRKTTRRFNYRTFMGREVALQKAIAHRQKLEAAHD